jgi:hypothetical protein
MTKLNARKASDFSSENITSHLDLECHEIGSGMTTLLTLERYGVVQCLLTPQIRAVQSVLRIKDILSNSQIVFNSEFGALGTVQSFLAPQIRAARYGPLIPQSYNECRVKMSWRSSKSKFLFYIPCTKELAPHLH